MLWSLNKNPIIQKSQLWAGMGDSGGETLVIGVVMSGEGIIASSRNPNEYQKKL